MRLKNIHLGRFFTCFKVKFNEIAKTFKLGIKLKLRKIKTEKLEIIVVVVILKTC